MDYQNILSHIDHTLLKPEATSEQIEKLCCEALEFKTASVCINPVHIRKAKSILKDEIPVCTVIGFPLGASTALQKALEAKIAIADGASEIDMVTNIGLIKEGRYDLVTEEIREVKNACQDKILKVIVETCLLTDEEKEKVCYCVIDAGADFIKTSTGFSTGGATFHDVEIFSNTCKGKIKIKAAGGMKSVEDMEKFLRLGADRLGSSSGVSLIREKLGK